MFCLNSKEYFEKYRSNTVAGTGNNYILKFDEPKQITGKICYRVRIHGRFNYRLFFSNIVDSTFDNGENSWANLEGEEYDITEAFAGDSDDRMVPVTFDGKKTKHVNKGETYWCDEINLNIRENHEFIFLWTVKGKSIPYTPDKIVPSYVKNEDGEFIEGVDFPQPHLIGCDCNFKNNIAFIGDSITMGLGTTSGIYSFWVSKITDGFGCDYSVWNLGLGFGRAQDAASNKVWLEKAKMYDIVSVCFGVNDILQGRNAAELKKDLDAIINNLKKENLKTCIFTIPTFDWEGESRNTWDEVNNFIRNDIANKTDYWFDMAKATAKDKPFEYNSRYGGHPDDYGCCKIAEKFLLKYKKL